MANIKNATPQSIRPGFKDEAAGTLVAEREQIPQHLAFLYLQTAYGPLDPQLVSGKALLDIYGSKTFDSRGKFFNHATFLAQELMGAGSPVFIKRVVSASARSAKIILALEVVLDDTIPVYLRDGDGKVLVDAGTGEKQKDGANVVEGYKARWKLIPVTDATNIREAATEVGGTLTGKVGEVSTIYPILGLETFIGDMGNSMGIRLSAPVEGTSDPADMKVILDQKTALYRAQLVERSVTGTSIVRETVNSARSIDFSFKEGVFNRATNLDLDAGRIVSEYQDIDPTSGRVPSYGPFSDMHVYEDNLETVLDMIKAQEETITSSTIADRHLINILTAVDINGAEYESFILSDDSLPLNDITTQFATGGKDGEVSIAELENLIIDEMNYNWENPDYALLDGARYPFSDLYDTGFKMETKEALIRALGYRPDVRVTLGPQDLSMPINDIATESSLANVLAAKVALFPESELYGTAVCRATLVGHAAPMVNKNYKKPVTLVHDLAIKRANYCGAGNGKMDPTKAYDTAPLNRVNGFAFVNNTYKKHAVREAEWQSGLNTVQYVDRQTLFYPAFQSVYKDDTSILNSEIIVGIMTDITKKCDIVWRQLTGNTKLTKSQFIEESNRIMNELVDGAYDDRVTIIPTTYFDKADDARGYSWTMDVAVYGDTMKTVGKFNVIARRRSDLEA